jgi:hypothetical protein
MPRDKSARSGQPLFPSVRFEQIEFVENFVCALVNGEKVLGASVGEIQLRARLRWTNGSSMGDRHPAFPAVISARRKF